MTATRIANLEGAAAAARQALAEHISIIEELKADVARAEKPVGRLLDQLRVADRNQPTNAELAAALNLVLSGRGVSAARALLEAK